MSTYLEILENALALSVQERRELILVIGESLGESASPPEVRDSPILSAAWRAEIAHRSQDIDNGQVEGMTWSETRQQVRSRHGLDA
jgi:putative addiction module component (TIGR02574 family)